MPVLTAVLALVIVSLGACAGGPEARKAKRYAEHQQCPEQRPQLCTMEYMPVCALLENGRRKEYASACNACSDTEVIGYNPDACP